MPFHRRAAQLDTLTGGGAMWTLRIDHRVSDFTAWKHAFDSDPVGRQAAGVRQHRVLRHRDEPDHVASTGLRHG
jgi:hypothetical protein